ncbi:MAG TPA: head GIN domain-containing protein, partial [Pyrinomonadaceae bacterium]|nr:head GIN domain-containing protein [Pyrinomonadaceae bacterium]
YMKKVGLIVFVVAVGIGVAVASLFSWGKATESIVHFNVNFGAEKGSGNVASERRTVEEFSKLDVSHVFQVEVVAQSDYAVEVEADDNLLQFIKTEVSGDTLHIELDQRVKTSNGMKIRISAPDIERVQASGASRVNISNLKNSELAIDTSGASKINVSGETGTLTVDVSGASQIDAGELSTVIANVDASGASHVNVNVSKDLTAEASGASRITYSGPAHVSKSTSGASSVSQK